MRTFSRRARRSGFFFISFALVCLLLSLWSLLFLLNAYLPDLPTASSTSLSFKLLKPHKAGNVQVGKLGAMMLNMLPDDLPFTMFIPSEEAFRSVLRLDSVNSLQEQRVNNTCAILSRVMGFSTVPRHLPARVVPMRKEMVLHSVSGFRLYAHRLSDGTLVINNVRAQRVDIRSGEIIVHIMGGVVMDAEFEQSFPPDYED